VRTFLNLTSFSPQMAYAVSSFLTRRKGGEESEETLEAWLAPPTLFASGKPPDDWGFTYALEVSEHLGFVQRTNGQLRSTLAVKTIGDFRQHARDRLMEKARTAFQEPEDPSDELTRALAWWSHQPAQPLTSTTFEGLMDGLPFKPIRQPTRWAVFERWALFLGFAWRLGDGLIPDPTTAVSDVLENVLPRGETLDAPALVHELANHLPVVDGGEAFQQYREEIRSKAPDDVLEAPLSMALLRLHDRGEIDFPPRGDAAGITLRCGSIERRIAQVRRTGRRRAPKRRAAAAKTASRSAS
jgi:hypothetical protein